MDTAPSDRPEPGRPGAATPSPAGVNVRYLDAAEARSLDLPWPDVYFTPQYGAAVEKTYGGAWEVAVAEPGPIVYPYVVRQIDDAENPSFDVISPYGYSGTWAPPEVPLAAWREFRTRIRADFIERGFVSEFQRLSSLVPGRDQLLASDPGLAGGHISDTLVVDIDRSYEDCWAGFESRARTKTRKARKLGYTWSCRPAGAEDVGTGSAFRKLYESTMTRVEAASYYFFSDQYYAALADGLGPALLVVEVRDATDTPAVAGLAFVWPPFLHMHLVGSDASAQRDGAGNMLYDGMIAWGCAQPELHTLHMGGGRVRDDALFYFKRGFGGSPVPYWTAQGVLRPAMYGRLVEGHAADLGVPVDALGAQGFFPAYRATVTSEDPSNPRPL